MQRNNFLFLERKETGLKIYRVIRFSSSLDLHLLLRLETAVFNNYVLASFMWLSLPLSLLWLIKKRNICFGGTFSSPLNICPGEEWIPKIFFSPLQIAHPINYFILGKTVSLVVILGDHCSVTFITFLCYSTAKSAQKSLSSGSNSFLGMHSSSAA